MCEAGYARDTHWRFEAGIALVVMCQARDTLSMIVSQAGVARDTH